MKLFLLWKFSTDREPIPEAREVGNGPGKDPLPPVEIGRSQLVDSGNACHSHPARVSAPNHLAARGLANLNLTRVISSL